MRKKGLYQGGATRRGLNPAPTPPRERITRAKSLRSGDAGTLRSHGMRSYSWGDGSLAAGASPVSGGVAGATVTSFFSISVMTGLSQPPVIL